MILEIGMKHTVETLVTPENTAAKAGSGNLQVFGTPFMVALMENAAMNTTHISPTPVGMRVYAEAEVINISANGKMVDFKVSAYDEMGLIGEGTHQRAVIDNDRFMEKANRKRSN